MVMPSHKLRRSAGPYAGFIITYGTYRAISSKREEGTAVYSSDGKELGSIDELMINKVSGQVRSAVLEFGGLLGMGTDRYPLP